MYGEGVTIERVPGRAAVTRASHPHPLTWVVSTYEHECDGCGRDIDDANAPFLECETCTRLALALDEPVDELADRPSPEASEGYDLCPACSAAPVAPTAA